MQSIGTLEEQPAQAASELAWPDNDRRKLPDRRRAERRATPRADDGLSAFDAFQVAPSRHGPRRRQSCSSCRFAHPRSPECGGVRLCLLAPSSGQVVIGYQAPCEAFERWLPADGNGHSRPAVVPTA